MTLFNLLIYFLISLKCSKSDNCPLGCRCEDDTLTTLVIRNTSIRSIPKNSFRKMDKIVNLEIVDNLFLNNIEKLAFKNMRRIRNAEKIRELTISGSDLALSRHSFANMNQLDFLTITGISLAEPELFTNSTRIYIVHFKNGHFDIPPNLFGGLTHVHHIFLENNIIDTIAPDAFTGLETVEFVELYNNRITSVKARAFTGVINLGKLKILRNSVAELDTSEAILSSAFETQVEGNTLDCECSLKWMTALDGSTSETNYCDASGAHRSVRSFINKMCSRKVEPVRKMLNQSISIDISLAISVLFILHTISLI